MDLKYYKIRNLSKIDTYKNFFSKYYLSFCHTLSVIHYNLGIYDD